MAEPSAQAAVSAAPAGGVGEAAHSGLPQFDFAYWPGQIFWLLITFAVVYVVLDRTILPRVRGTLTARDARIEADMAAARTLRDEADAQARAAEAEMAQARAKAQKLAADAKAEAQAQSTARTAALETELNAKLAVAEAGIAHARDAAMTHVRGVAADAAAAMTEKLTGRAPDGPEVEAAFARLGPRA